MKAKLRILILLLMLGLLSQVQSFDIERCRLISCSENTDCHENDESNSIENVAYLICLSNHNERVTENDIQSAVASTFYEIGYSDPPSGMPNNISDISLSICHYCDITNKFCEKLLEEESTTCFESRSICCSNDTHNIFTYNPCYPQNTTCEMAEAENHEVVLNSITTPYFIFGLISIIGNFVVIFQKIKTMCTQPNRQKEMKIFIFLVLNLSLADLLMGIYIFALSTSIIAKSNSADHFIEYTFCNILGVMNFASSQISVTILVLISSFRWYSVAYPYKRVSLKLAYYLVIVTWIIWTFLAFVPILPTKPLQTFFHYGVRLDQGKEHDLHLVQPIAMVKNLLRATNDSGQYDDILSGSYTSNEAIKVLEKLQLVDPVNDIAEPLGYYNLQPVCSINLILSDHFSISSYFTLFVLLYNLVCFVVISMCYTVILKSMFDSGDSWICKCLSSKKNNKVTDVNITKSNNRQYAENKSMFRRVIFVIATDFICWVPICMISVIFFINSAISDEHCGSSRQHTCRNLTLYHGIQIAVFYIIPINSGLNPYVYSYQFWKELVFKLKCSVLNLRVCGLFVSSNNKVNPVNGSLDDEIGARGTMLPANVTINSEL